MSFYFTQMLIANNFLFCFLGSHAELDTGMEGNKQSYLSRSFKKAFSKSKIKEKAIQYVTNFWVSELEFFSIARMEANLLRKYMMFMQ